jgi:rhodanese-related sulfurtransferase
MTTTTNPTITITPDMTMEQVLAIAPAAQRALFQRYHVGGCSSCGFQPTDTLAQLCKDHNILDVKEVIQTIHTAQDADTRLNVDVKTVKQWLDQGEDFSFIDVRTPQELAIARIRQAEPLDYDAPDKYMSLPKDRRIVFSCKSGMRSLDVAAYFAGHGFTNVRSMRGGIDAWRAEVDPTIPRY